MPPNSRSMSARACAGDRLHAARRPRPAGSRAGSSCRRRPSRGCGAARRRARSCSIADRRGVGHLVAQQAEDLLADELGGEKALVAVGELVLADTAAATTGSASRDLGACSSASCAPRSAEIGTIAANGYSGATSASRGSSARLSRDEVDLVERGDDRHARRQQRDHRAVGLGHARRRRAPPPPRPRRRASRAPRGSAAR